MNIHIFFELSAVANGLSWWKRRNKGSKDNEWEYNRRTGDKLSLKAAAALNIQTWNERCEKRGKIKRKFLIENNM